MGGGIMGCSVAYHLAVAGLKPLVLERRGIAQAASSRAAGLLTRARSKPALLPLVRQTYEDIRTLEEELGEPLGLHRTGSLYVGASEPVKRAHRELMMRAQGQGETVRRLSHLETLDKVSWLGLRGEEEVFFMPEDGYIDGYALGSAYARAARAKGASSIRSPPSGAVAALTPVRTRRRDEPDARGPSRSC